MHWLTRRPPAVEVFAVEPDRAQLVWRRAGPGTMSVKLTQTTSTSHTVTVDTDGGPGTLQLTELAPNTDYEVTIGGHGLAEVDRRHRFVTPVDPPGQLLTRLATVNDAHIGGDRFGYLKTIRERPEPSMPSSERCLRAAIDAMSDWGATHAVLKGDIVNHGTAEEWAVVHDILTTLPFDFDVVLGNHEACAKRGIAATDHGAAESFGIAEPVRVRDLPGIRLVLADTPVGSTNRGDIAHVADDIVDAAAEAPTPVLVCLHHNLQAHRLPTFLPPGIPGHRARRFLDQLVATATPTITVSGHTHRNRRRDHGPIPVVEVGSPKDYPGVWAGYAVHEGGIRQVSYRVAPPDCLGWTERTRWAAFGLWGRWSPGELSDRCFTHPWPAH